MNLDQALHELKQAAPFMVAGSPYPRIRISMASAKALHKATQDYCLGQRIADAAKWNEQFVRIYTEDRERLLVAMKEAA